MARARLDGRRVLITGASSGVGAATAEAFARAGADVAVLARSQPGLEVVAERVRALGRRAVVVPADVTDRAAVSAAVARAESELGGLDVLVSNAGGTVFGTFAEVAPEDFDRVIANVFLGAVNVIRAALPALERAERGRIVVTGSIMAKVPLPTFGSYAAAKHALRGFVGTLRVELAAQRSPVRISMVHPGAIDTPLWGSTSSANGRLPRHPPEGYHPSVIADALVACAARPRAEVTIGLEAKAIELLFVAARPLGDLLLRAVHLWYLSGRRPARARGALQGPVGEGQVDGRLIGRPSLWAPIRLLRK